MGQGGDRRRGGRRSVHRYAVAPGRISPVKPAAVFRLEPRKIGFAFRQACQLFYKNSADIAVKDALIVRGGIGPRLQVIPGDAGFRVGGRADSPIEGQRRGTYKNPFIGRRGRRAGRRRVIRDERGCRGVIACNSAIAVFGGYFKIIRCFRTNSGNNRRA